MTHLTFLEQESNIFPRLVYCCMLQCVAVCCSALQCVAVRCSVLQCVAVCCTVLPCVAACVEFKIFPTQTILLTFLGPKHNITPTLAHPPSHQTNCPKKQHFAAEHVPKAYSASCADVCSLLYRDVSVRGTPLRARRVTPRFTCLRRAMKVVCAPKSGNYPGEEEGGGERRRKKRCQLVGI